METLGNLMGEHPCIVNIPFVPLTCSRIERFHCIVLGVRCLANAIRAR